MNSATQEAGLLIETLYREGNRTVEAMKACYRDTSAIREVVHRLGKRLITPDQVAGKRVLLKPNWVKHDTQPGDAWCLRTHDAFTLAVLEFVLTLRPAKVMLGDAPIQGCRWNDLLSTAFIEQVNNLANTYNITVQVKDFRRMVFHPEGNMLETERNPLTDYLFFDVGAQSYLEPVTSGGVNLFRVSQYNPDRFRETHRPGIHRYCITRELFQADVVISLPKIKTHQKSGITAALKNIVGLNGDKDFLPHHRIGGSEAGGDSYQGSNILRYWSELALDQANRRKGRSGYTFWRRMAALLWKVSLPNRHLHQPNGAWYGNDTTWRMVMDLNLVIYFGTEDGILATTPQRKLFHFCDGIIAGQGDGPLHPEPLPLGVVMLSDSAALNDYAAALLMGMQPERIPLLKAAEAWIPDNRRNILLNGCEATLQQLTDLSLSARMPPGWQGYAA